MYQWLGAGEGMEGRKKEGMMELQREFGSPDHDGGHRDTERRNTSLVQQVKS